MAMRCRTLIIKTNITIGNKERDMIIDKNVPLPKQKINKDYLETAKKMEIGDSVFFKDADCKINVKGQYYSDTPRPSSQAEAFKKYMFKLYGKGCCKGKTEMHKKNDGELDGFGFRVWRIK